MDTWKKCRKRNKAEKKICGCPLISVEDSLQFSCIARSLSLTRASGERRDWELKGHRRMGQKDNPWGPEFLGKMFPFTNIGVFGAYFLNSWTFK